MQIESRVPDRWRSALVSSAVTAGTLMLCAIVFSTSIGLARPIEVLGLAVVLFALVFCSLVLGGRKALLLLWVAVVTFWVALLHSEFDAAGWIFARAVRNFPEVFVAWSMLAVPLGAGTAVFLHHSNRKWFLRQPVSTGCAIWAALLIASAYLARHAPDVGANPRDHPLSIAISALLVPAALFASSAFIWAIARDSRRPTSTGVSPEVPADQ